MTSIFIILADKLKTLSLGIDITLIDSNCCVMRNNIFVIVYLLRFLYWLSEILSQNVLYSEIKVSTSLPFDKDVRIITKKQIVILL